MQQGELNRRLAIKRLLALFFLTSLGSAHVLHGAAAPSSQAQKSFRDDAIQVSETIDISSLGGGWNFSTDVYRSGFCKMTGNLVVFPEEQPSETASCQLTAVEECGDERSVVQQSCSLTLTSGTVVIESEIEQFIERKPSSMGYLPDNFILTEVSAVEMTGALDSAVSSFVVFRRQYGGIS